MNYFRINLNKTQRVATHVQQAKKDWMNSGLILMGMLVVLGIALVKNGQLNTKISEFKAKSAQLSAQITSLEKNRNYISEKEVRSLHRLDRKRILT